MTSSYSTDLKLELMVTGENAGTWGDNTNNNLNLIQQAISGFEQVTLNSGSTLALAMTDKTISNARNMVIKFATASIAASTICTIPDSIEKFYIFDATGVTNPTNLTIKTASGTGFTLDAAKIYAAYSDGTNLNEISLDTLGGTVAAANITGTIATSQIADDAVTLAKMAPGTDGNIISYDASGNPVAVATGTAGQILTSAGAGAPPTFADASSGGTSWVTTPKTATFTAVAGEGYFANTTSTSFTMNLPAGVAGETVAVADYAETWGTNSLVITPDGSDKIKAGVAGDSIYLNTSGTSMTLVFVDSTQGWIPVADSEYTHSGSDFIVATGGTITCSGNFKIHTFTGPGTFDIIAGGGPQAVVDYLVVAGGGGGSRGQSGGGGGGGYRESPGATTCYTASPLGASPAAALSFAPGPVSIPVTVGAGGSSPPTGKSTPGGDSIFSTITGTGGGVGGSPSICYTAIPTVSSGGGPGGSGGGGSRHNGQQTGGSGNTPPVSPAQGQNGASGNCSGSGGGGGAIGAGVGDPQKTGGVGTSTSITGSPLAFSGGGGGGNWYNPPGPNPSPCGTGGRGSPPSHAPATAGTTNRGGGGGGGGDAPPGLGGAGGSGLVVIRYKYQ